MFFISVDWCGCSVAALCPPLCTPMDRSMPGLPVPHHLLEFSHAHSCPLNQRCHPTISSSVPFSSSAFSLSQHQSLFQWVSSSHQVAKVSELQHQSFQKSIQGWFLLGLTGLMSLQSKGLSRVCSSTTVWKHQFFITLHSSSSSSHIRTWQLERL